MSSELSDEMAREEPAAAPAGEAVADEPAADTLEQSAAGEAAPDESADTSDAVAHGSRPLAFELLQRIVEGALMAAGKPLAVEDIAALFDEDQRPTAQEIRAALAAIAGQCGGRGFELREVASGFRFQVVQDVAQWIARLWEEKPQKYSRALLETLALIAYRQPITRGDIEDIRGVAVATNIIKTLLERDWVRVVGHKDVPGRPAMYATTRRFLDYFNLKNLDELPALADLRDLDALSAQLSIEGADTLLPEQLQVAASEPGQQPQAGATVDGSGDEMQEASEATAVLENDIETEFVSEDIATQTIASATAESESVPEADLGGPEHDGADEGELRTESGGSGH